MLSLASVESAVLSSEPQTFAAEQSTQNQEESLIASEIVENVIKSAAESVKSEVEQDFGSQIIAQSDDEEVLISEHASELENVSDLDPLPSPQRELELELPSPVLRPDEPSPTIDTPYETAENNYSPSSIVSLFAQPESWGHN